ncbi:hypothetical protein [Parvicella tangerina]|uniref:Uncharacterized protein n=1 Tax=Parvicella tangerina TaxID=2829795 RepID=A0A916NCU6_9FLAO|nr:hypothetical protein [Parvicella tangerina]CAG5083765.1 hypothetical protein CRYO30217_02283 [Parvicella tangerina]
MQNLDTEITGDLFEAKRTSKRKKATIIAIAVLLVLTLIAYLYHSLIPVGFKVALWYEQVIYVVLVYGLPVLGILISFGVGALIALLMNKERTYKERIWKSFRGSYLVFMVFNFLVITLFQVGIATDPNNPFDAVDFQEIATYTGDTEDLKVGNFKTDNYYFERFEDYQIEYDPYDGTSLKHKIGWINSAEYYLVDSLRQYGVDTLYVKITNNTADYYECYISADKKEAIYGKLYKVKE